MLRYSLLWLSIAAVLVAVASRNERLRGTEPAPEPSDKSRRIGERCAGVSYGVPAAPARMARLDHSEAILAVAMTPDGSMVATGDCNAAIRLWDAKKGNEIASLSGHEGAVTALDVAPDGSLLASVGFDGVRLWRLPKGEGERHFQAKPGSTTWVRFAPDGASLASGGPGPNEPVRIWDVATGRELTRLVVGPRGPNCAAWSLDGLKLATGYLRTGDVAGISVWEIGTGRELIQTSGHPGGVQKVEFTSDGRRIISADSTGELVVWDAESGVPCYRRLLTHEREMTSLALSRDSGILASASRDRTVRYWELVTGQEIARFTDHEGSITSVALSADGRLGVSGGLDAMAFTWDIAADAGSVGSHNKSTPLTVDEPEAVWSDLISRDAVRAQRTAWVLTARPELAVRLVESHLRPLPENQRSRIVQAIAELNHARGAIRRQAMQELMQFGELAEFPLRHARATRPPLEVHQRLELLLEAMQGPARSPETLGAVRGVQVLERIGNAEARRVLAGLAQGPDDDRLTLEAAAALRRLGEVPKSEPHAVQSVIETPPDDVVRGQSAATTKQVAASATLKREPDLASETDRADSDASTVAAEIDRMIEVGWEGAGVLAAPAADDGEFLRRATLDIAGRIPLAYETRDFIDDTATDKRPRLIDQLLSSSECHEHLAHMLRDLLLPPPGGPEDRPTSAQEFAPAMEQWLRECLLGNRGYDSMIRDLLVTALPDQRQRIDRAASSPLGFYFRHEDASWAGFAGDTSRLFLGLKLECAECHNHPFAPWTREQFWEFAAFFSGILIGGANEGKLFHGEEPDSRSLQIPGGDKVATARFPDGNPPTWREGVATRELLAEWITAPGNPYFARTFVNRIWADFFGAGLVEPIDEANDPGATGRADLLDMLARRFVDHGFDIKFLIRAITLSRTYQRTSRLTHDSQRDVKLLAKMPVRGLTAEQLYDSLVRASGYREQLLPLRRELRFYGRVKSPRSAFTGRFADAGSRAETETSMLDALFLMNGQFMGTITQPGGDKTLDVVVADKSASVADSIETLYLAALSRTPRPGESARMVQYVESRIARNERHAGFADVLWALLNSGEFMSNH